MGTKYITTETNPVFKKGLELIYDSDSLKCVSLDNIELILEYNHIESWVRNGWIEEVELVEFTKSDMVDCLGYVFLSNAVLVNVLSDTPKTYVNNWLKQKNK